MNLGISLIQTFLFIRLIQQKQTQDIIIYILLILLVEAAEFAGKEYIKSKRDKEE